MRNWVVYGSAVGKILMVVIWVGGVGVRMREPTVDGVGVVEADGASVVAGNAKSERLLGWGLE